MTKFFTVLVGNNPGGTKADESKPDPPKGKPEDPPEAKPETSDRRSKLLFTRLQLGLAMLLLLTYWIVILILPGSGFNAPPLTRGVVYGITGLVALAMIAALIAGMFRKKSMLNLASCFVLFLDIIVALGLTGTVHFNPELKFTMAVGGGAMAAFLLGIVVFDTVRVAASLPIVVLFIGMVSYPVEIAGFTENRAQVIIFMGIILGVAATAEGVTQAAKAIGRAQVTKAVIADPGTTTPDLGKALSTYANDVRGDLVAADLTDH